MNIAILGTRGIPNRYGGYERLAELLALGLAGRGHELTVYSPHNHTFQKPSWNGINIIHIEDLEYKLGSIGRFIYNYNCLKDVRTKDFDVLIQLDYTTISVFGFLFPRNAKVITLIDGLSGKQAKHGKLMQQYLSFAEKMAVKHSDLIVTDATSVERKISNKYEKKAVYIPFGAEIPSQFDDLILQKYNLSAGNYNMLFSKLIPENRIEEVLDGVVLADNNVPFLVVGNDVGSYALALKEKYQTFKNILFLGAIYDAQHLNNLRHYSNLCFHNNWAYSANLALFDAMASGSLIVANNNKINKDLLGENGYYFNDAYEVAKHLIKRKKSDAKAQEFIFNNTKKIAEKYNWRRVIDNYEDCLLQPDNMPIVKRTELKQLER